MRVNPEAYNIPDEGLYPSLFGVHRGPADLDPTRAPKPKARHFWRIGPKTSKGI